VSLPLEWDIKTGETPGLQCPIDQRDEEQKRSEVFVTWQAERVIGDYDRNTLRLRLDPQGEAEGFEPGATVWIKH
jgi:hypothetical protein